MGRRGRSNLAGETVFFITTTVFNHTPVFLSNRYCDLLLKNIRLYQGKYKFRIHGYVIMPTHFHWIISLDPAEGTVSDIMRDIKKYSAWDILDAIESDGRADLLSVFSDSKALRPGQKRVFWTPRFDDVVISNGQMYDAKLEYIHGNPVRAGIVSSVGDYRYSSARNYFLNDDTVLEVERDWR